MTLLSDVRGEADAPPLWTQSMNMYRRWKSQKGWVTGDQLLHHLVDLGEHPDEEVTSDSLQAAFAKMPAEQIDSIMSMLKKEAEKREAESAVKEDETLRAVTDVRADLADMFDQVRIITHTSCKTQTRVYKLEAEMAAQQKSAMAELKAAAAAAPPPAAAAPSSEY